MIATEDCCILTVGLPDAGRPTELPLWRATNAAEALSILRLARIDLMLTGLVLPDMSPWQFVRRVRASARAPRWALVAAEMTVQDEIEARALGAAAVLERMPEPDTLLAMLAKARQAPAAQPSRPILGRDERGDRSEQVSSTQHRRRRLPIAARTAGVGTDGTL
ncbi:MAG: response regulator [Tepidisphaeraceae bacterium]